MILPPPVRFLALVFGAWGLGRAVVLNLPEEVKAPARRLVAAVQGLQQSAEGAFVVRIPPAAGETPAGPEAPPAGQAPRGEAQGVEIVLPRPTYTLHRELTVPVRFDPVPALVPVPAAAATPRESRWSGSSWLFLRGKAGSALAPGGTLGGSQAGGRIGYALHPQASLSARAYLPLEVPDEAELAVGVDLKPVASLPVRMLLERREAVGKNGRSAFSATLYGGVSDRPVMGPVELDAWAQAGVVGLRSRDLFADGSAKLHVKTAGMKLGAGMWAAAQPGAERVDVGPTLSLPLPIGTVQADWRFRVAGAARPGSGPAITLAADF